MSLRSIISQNVRMLRNRRGVSQAALSKNAGIGEGVIKSLESGRSWPEEGNIEKLARALGVEPIELFTATPINRPPEAVSSQEKLSVAALQLDDASAALLLDMAKDFLTRRPEEAVRAAESLLSEGNPRKKKAP